MNMRKKAIVMCSRSLDNQKDCRTTDMTIGSQGEGFSKTMSRATEAPVAERS